MLYKMSLSLLFTTSLILSGCEGASTNQTNTALIAGVTGLAVGGLIGAQTSRHQYKVHKYNQQKQMYKQQKYWDRQQQYRQPQVNTYKQKNKMYYMPQQQHPPMHVLR